MKAQWENPGGSFVCALGCCLLGATVMAQTPENEGRATAEGDRVLPAEVFVASPEDLRAIRDASAAAVESADAGPGAGPAERLIYSNTLGLHLLSFPSNQPVSDDIATTATPGCSLRRYRFFVTGKVLESGMGGEFTVTYGIYRNCPFAAGSTNTARDLVLIPGTQGQISFPDDGLRIVEHVVPADQSVPLPSNFYVGMRFSRSNCGTVVGAPAMTGYSDDRLDFPGFPCNGFLGGFPQFPHASFWLEVFGDESCGDGFAAYKADKESGSSLLMGANVQGVDDATLIAADCQMVGYEVGVKGVGNYAFELRRECHGAPIDGTQRTFSVFPNTSPLLQTARFSIDPPIALGTDRIYLAFKSDASAAGVVNSGIRPAIGTSGLEYFASSDGCHTITPPSAVHGAVQFSVQCGGTLPQGACCDPHLTQCLAGPDEGARCVSNGDCAKPGTCEAVCRQTTELNCPFPPEGTELQPQWEEGKACEPDPFGNNPCGVAACCYWREYPPTKLLQKVCQNLTNKECESQLQEPSPPDWQLGLYCGVAGQRCERVICPRSPFDSPFGCVPSNDPYCCEEICSSGPEGAYCCNVAWDELCCQMEEELCTYPPGNDQCAPGYPEPALSGALLIPFPGSVATNNSTATTSGVEPGFCCNQGVGECVGGTRPGSGCVVDQDCPEGSCTPRIPMPGAKGLGTVWFKFTLPPGQTTAGLHTCNSNSPALDSIVQVFAATDHSSQLAECQSLYPIACNDDAVNCASTNRNSRLCLQGLTPGETYYVMLAAKTENRLGEYRVTLTTSCAPTAQSNCCPTGPISFIDPPTGVVDARRQTPFSHRSLLAIGPPASSLHCWTLCDSQEGDATDAITRVSEDAALPGRYWINLSRPMRPGAVTTVTYTAQDFTQSIGHFVLHPGNVNADAVANAADVLALIDHLNGIKQLPWGVYSGDIDHSGMIMPSDVIGLIDVLNTGWYGTARPVAGDCP